MRIPRLLTAVLPLATVLSLWPSTLANAQSVPQPPAPGFTVGTQMVESSTWNFEGDLDLDAGPWGNVTVTNTSCAMPYRPGTAQAGAILFSASLQPTPTTSGLTIAQGDLLPFTGSSATGFVTVLTPPSTDAPTHVDAMLIGLEEFALNNTLSVCLTPANNAMFTADVATDADYVTAQSYEPFQILITPTTPDGPPLISIAAFQTPTADAYTQFVFFFIGSTFLGTDTSAPSPQLELTGSPGPSQVDVQYANYAPNDPLCCPSLPPVTITYTWDGASLTPNGVPPGH
jgi:LppP/LprE lipoprotein